MASSPARPFASPLQRFPAQSSTSQAGSFIPSPSTSFAPAPAEPSVGAGGDPPRLAQLSPSDQVAFSIFPLGAPADGARPAEVRWRCFQAISGAKDDAVLALNGVRDLVGRSWAAASPDDGDDELEEGQEQPPPSKDNIFTSSVLAAVVPFSPRAFAKQPVAVQPQPPQPSPESIGGIPAEAAAPAEVITGKEDGGEVWVFHVRSSPDESDASKLFSSLPEHLPEGLKETSNGSFKPGDLFPALPSSSNARSTSIAALLPVAHLRKVYPLLVSAARERMLAQLIATSAAGAGRSHGRALRCGDSVVLYTGSGEEEGDVGKTGREWGETWTTGVAAEPDRSVLRLTFALDLLPAPHNAFLFVPRIQRIPSFPLAFHPQLRQFSATPPAKPIPVRLLPFDAPAFYLRKSTASPSAVDTDAFWDALTHTGARRPDTGKDDDWAVCWVPAPDDVGMKSGSLLSWHAQLVLVDSATVELAAETSPRPAATKLKPTSVAQAANPQQSSSACTGSRTASLADSWRRLTSKTAHHFAPALPSPPDSTEASSPPRETVFDDFEDIALATGSYLEGIVKAREQERERVEAEKEKERRRKEGGGAQTPATTDPAGSPEGSDDLWGSPPADEPEVTSRHSSTTLHLPAVSLPPQSAPPEHAQQANPPSQPVPHPPPAPHASVFDPGGEMMDWSWDASNGGAAGGMRAFGVDPLSGLPDEPSWGGPEQVTEDDFDFFDATPLDGRSHDAHPFADMAPPQHPVPPPSEPLSQQQPVNVSDSAQILPPAIHEVGADASTSYVDPSFSLSPLPSFVPPDGENGEFTLSQLMDVDLAAPSPLDFATFNTQSAVLPGAAAAPAEQSPHPGGAAPSPASWLVSRTPKTPKTPFSPFIDVVEEEDDEGDKDANAATPHVRFVVDGDVKPEPALLTGPLALYVPRAFQPVVFGRSHIEADEKYGFGKFSFPTTRLSADPQADLEEARRALLPSKAKKRAFPADFASARPSFRELFARASTPEPDDAGSDTDSAALAGLDNRLLYNRAADPRLGVIGRIKRHHKRLRAEPGDRPRSSSNSNQRDAAFYKSPPPEGADQSDNDDDDEASVARFDGPHSTAGGPEIDLHSHSRRDEVDPPVGGLFVAHLRTGAFPSELVPLPTTVNRSAYAYGPPPSISTPMPLSALTPGPMAASTPAWAPTPTSPPHMPPPLKEYSKEAMTAFISWLLAEVASNPILFSDILQAADDGAQVAPHFLSDTDTAAAAFKLHSAALSTLLDPSAGADRSALVRATPSSRIAVGFQGRILKLTPEALPFWGKIRLEPVGGKKDVVAFVVYQSTGAGMNATVSKWLAGVGKVYEAQGFGRHVSASIAGVQNGLVAVDAHQLAESLRPLLAQLGSIPHAIFYILAPPSVLSPIFDLREVQQQLSGLLHARDAQVLAQLVPYADVFDPPTGSALQRRLARVVYDRLERKIERLIPRRIFDDDTSSPALVSYPAFHLARPEPPALQFQLKWPPPPLNLLDRHAFLHVAYGLSVNGDWLFGCAVDARGQAQQAFSMRVDGPGASTLDTAVREVYTRATAFAKRADAEWRIVVARLGAPSLDEVSAWDRLLSKEIAGEGQAFQILITAAVQQTLDPVLLCGSASKAFSNASSPANAAPLTAAPPSIVDGTRTGSILSPRYRRPLALVDSNSKPSIRSKYSAGAHPPPRKDNPPTLILPLSSFTLASSPGNPSPTRGAASPPSHVCSHLLLVGATPTAAAPPTADFDALGKDLADSYHALALLAHHRWLTAASDPVGRLPLHLAAVARMTKAHGMLNALLS